MLPDLQNGDNDMSLLPDYLSCLLSCKLHPPFAQCFAFWGPGISRSHQKTNKNQTRSQICNSFENGFFVFLPCSPDHSLMVQDPNWHLFTLLGARYPSFDIKPQISASESLDWRGVKKFCFEFSIKRFLAQKRLQLALFPLPELGIFTQRGI